MAGVGFELRKLLNTQSVSRKFTGVLYASFVIIGPILAFIALLILIHVGMWFYGIGEADRLMFTTTILYMMISSVVISTIINTVLSRYIADSVFNKDNEKINSSVLGAVCLSAMLSMVAGAGLIVPMVALYNLSIIYAVGLYLFLMMISMAFVVMSYISAIKEYAKVARSFFIGLAFGAAVFLLLYYVFQAELVVSFIYAMMATFFVIDVLLLVIIRTFFRGKGRFSFDFLSYFKKYPALLFSGLFYIFGMYAHNIIFWYFSDIYTQVMYLKILPSYDMATFLAMLINLSAMVIFVVKVETSFYERYQVYIKNISSANYEEIEKSRKNMQRVLDHELFYLYEVQLVITIVLIALGMVFLPRFNFGGMVLDYFTVLGMAYFCTFCMYLTVIFLYYFDDQKGALLTTMLFFGITVGTSLILTNISSTYFGLGLLIGAVASWIFGFNRLKYFIKHINRNMYCAHAKILEAKK